MWSVIDPSRLSSGGRSRPMSATIWPGIENSASARPSASLLISWRAFGPGSRNSISWRSPMNVSVCQSTDRNFVSKILSRSMPALEISPRSRPAAAADRATSSLRFLQKRANASDCRWARLATPAQVKDKARIFHRFSHESGSWHVADFQELLHVSKNMHDFSSPLLGDSALLHFQCNFLLV